DQVEVHADSQTKEGNIARAAGNVVVTTQDMRIEADDVTYNQDTNIVTAGDHIVYTRGQEHLDADHATINVETKVGDFKNVSGEVGPGFFIKAEEAHRTGDGRYELKNAIITTCCDAERPGWTLAIARAIVDPHRRVTANGSLFRLENIPVFYMPYVVIP